MIRLKRRAPEPRIEMTPLIDVVFLLLTFFVFSLLLMVRADVLDLTLPQLGAGEDAARQQLLTIALRDDGSLALQGESVDRDALLERLQDARESRPDARIVIAADRKSPSGDLIELVDMLTGAGMTEVTVMGK